MKSDYFSILKEYWYYGILAIIFPPIGAIVAYFLLKKNDRKAALFFLYIGIVLAIIGLLINGFIR